MIKKKYLVLLMSGNLLSNKPTVEIELPGLLGNRLFGFCMGKIIAEELGYNLYCKPIWGFPNTYDYIHNKPSNKYRTEFILAHQEVDLNKIIKNHTERNIKIEGYFQRYKYMRPYEEKIRKNWLIIDPQLLYKQQDPNDIVLHVRAKYKPHFVPFEFYEKALASTPHNRIFICTDEPNDPFLDNFKKYNPIIHSTRCLSELIDRGMSWDEISKLNFDEFLFICSFNKIIVSSSTFSWWAGYLSDATEIYAPNSIFDHDQNYGKVDQERYHYIDTIIG
jgi:hypothetical protein